jgi:hypothetical protein
VTAPIAGARDMTDRRFDMELSCRYQRPDNTRREQTVRCAEDGQWRVFQLGVEQPGFLIFVYALLNCQHVNLLLSAAERGLRLANAQGTINVVTDSDWVIRRLHIRFAARLASGIPTAQDVEAIVARMGGCPVSRNLRNIADSRTTVEFEDE